MGRDTGGNINSNRFGFCAGGSGNTKTAFGYFAGNVSSNVRNVFVGSLAGQYNSGFYNTVVGQCAMRGSGGGCKSTAIGQRALQSWASGRDVHAVGSFAGNGNNGVQNAFVGVNAGRCNTADNSTIVGVDAGCNTTGTENTAVGFRALRINSSGIRNLALGACAVYGGNASWRIGIGYNSQPSATYGHISWGNSYNNQCNCVYGSWYYGSDGRDKTNVTTLRNELGLNFLRKLRPVSYVWDNRDHYVDKCGFEYGQKDGTLADPKKHYGLIAQELKQVLTELNETFDGLKYDEVKDSYRVEYTSFIAPLTKAVKELDERTQQLKQQVGLI